MLLVDSIIFRQHKPVGTIQGRILNISLAVALNSTRSKYIDRAYEACIFIMNVHGSGVSKGGGAPGARAPPSALAQQPGQLLSGNCLC